MAKFSWKTSFAPFHRQKNQRTVREANTKKVSGKRYGMGFWGFSSHLPKGDGGWSGGEGFSGYGSGAASLNRAAKICVPQVASLVGRRRVTSTPNCSLLEALRLNPSPHPAPIYAPT